MDEVTIYKGIWWLPDRPEKQIPGELIINALKEAHLELQGTLKDEAYSNSDLNSDLLLGFTNSGKEITLYRCLSTSLTHSSSGFPTSKFLAHFVVIGAHFETEEQIRFKNLSVNYAYLDEWVDRKDIQYERGDKDNFVIRYSQSSPIRANVADYQITLRPCYSLSESRIRVNLSQTAMIDVSFEKEQTLDQYLMILRRLQDFLSLGMGMPTRPLEVFGQTDQLKMTLGDDKEYPKPIEIHYQAMGSNVDIKEVHSFNMPFTLTHIQDRIETYLGNWMSKADLLSPVYSLFFASLYNPHQYLESTFLNLIQAVETYHRRRFGGKYQTDEEYHDGLYRVLVDSLPEGIDPGFRQALIGGKLKYANEFSLRKRVQQLAKRLSPYVALGFLRSKQATDTFADKVHDTRNYLTHFSPDQKTRSAEHEELYVISQQLRGILELCLFEEIGFDKEMIRKIVSQNRRYSYLLGQNTTF